MFFYILYGTQYIQKSMPRRFLFLCNKKDQTPGVVFTENHVSVVEQGQSWLSSTSEACSVVAGFFVSITFSTATSVPDDVKGDKHVKASKIFAASSFVSFYTSLIAVVMFLSILTSGCKRKRSSPCLTMEAFVGFDSILHVYSFNLSIFYNRTFLHLQGSTKICVFHLVYSDLPAGNNVFYSSLSTLLSFDVGYLQEGATT